MEGLIRAIKTHTHTQNKIENFGNPFNKVSVISINYINYHEQ